MSDFISFDIKIPGTIRLKLTNKAMYAAEDLGCGSMWFKRCSATNRILISRGTKNDVYFLHIGGNVFTCTIAAEDNDRSSKCFLITNTQKENYSNKNNALHSGLCFYFESGIIISYYNSTNGFHYKNGNSILSQSANVKCTAGIAAIVSSFDSKASEVSETEEEYQPSPELMEYLGLAKMYSDAEYELEEERALTNGALYYDSISGCDYARIANSAYRFYVDRFDDKNYVPNTRVEVTDINDEKLRATVLDAGIDDDGKPFADLLFNEQLSIDSLQSAGSITLSFSSVNRDVQQRAIEKITDGTADAKYMNDVIGNAEPIGFDDVDLTSLTNELSQYKYPPNQSQVDGIVKGIQTKDVYLVMGPPGTGKTTVILEWIKYFVKEKNMRVLISSQNNKAVDNVLERIIQEDGIDALRIGSESKVTEQVKPCLFELKLESLRDKIKVTTDRHAETITEYSDYWTEARKMLSSMEEHYMKKAELEEKLNSACMQLAKDRTTIDTNYTNYNILLRKIEEDVNKINNLIDKEMKYRSRGALLRFLLKIFSFIRNIRIEFGVSKYDKNHSHLLYIYDTYNKQCTQFAEFYDSTAFDVFAPERETAELISREMENIHIDYDGKKDPWNIFDFDSCRSMDITSYAFYSTLMSNMQSGLSRAASLGTELKKWQSIAVDTSNYTLKSILLDGVNLVGATCIGINSQHRFAELKFDVSIIDEAGQIQIHNALVPMSVSNKLIMLGDHKQIPPMADPDLVRILKEHGISTHLLEKSLFEDMYNRLPESNKSMLDTQYRMPSEIADIISTWFYGGNYKSFSGKSNLTSVLPLLSEHPFLIIDTSNSGTERYERSISQGEQIVHDNPLEASVAAKIVTLLDKKGYNLDNVGIIAALKAQVDLIRKELKRGGIPAETTVELAATLDSYQGQERDVIIYSFGRSSAKEPSKNGVGFLTELRRLNVAMSRCKKTLIMIGDMKFLSERESETDYTGSPILDEDKTEKNFSNFIRHMLTCVRDGAGEVIDVNEFEKRMNVWKQQG